MIETVIAFFVILTILVLIHELGHFITAKKFGIKVEEFGFGFPPRVFSIRYGETLYSINLLPIGGFVKLYGEDDAGGGSIKKHKGQPTKDLGRAFFARPVWQRATIVLAGVVMNFLLAVVLISILFSTEGVAVPTKNIKIVDVVASSPAARAGIKSGDEVITINGKGILKTEEFSKLARDNAGKEISIVLKRDGKTFEKKVMPRSEYPDGEGPMGVSISNVELKKYPWYQAPFYGTLEALNFSVLILQGLGEMVVNLVTGKGASGIAGPVGVAQLTGQAVSYGWVATLWFVSLLSLNLAVVNVLPIPALDGGRLFFIVIEMVTRRKVSQKYEAIAHGVGLAVLLGLILFITFFDIVRLITGQSILPTR